MYKGHVICFQVFHLQHVYVDSACFCESNVLTVREILQCKAEKERIASCENIAVFRVNCDSDDLQLYMCCGLKSVNVRFIIAHADSLQLSTHFHV